MSTEYSPVYSPRFELTVGGTTYQEVGGQIADLVAETTVDGADRCSFTFNHPFNLEQGDIADLEWEDVEPGTPIELAVGWGGAGSIEPLFVGTSHAVEVEFTPSVGGSVAVSGYGRLHEMMRGVVERSWSDTTVADVAREVLSSYFPEVTVEGSTSTRNRIIQHDQNDYRFVRQLAAEYGFEFYTERDTAYFTPRSSLGGDPDMTLTYGNTLDAFSAELTMAEQIESVEVRYWDMNAEKEIVGSASKPTGEGKKVFRIACDSKEEAESIAESKLSELSMARATGYGQTDGIPALTAGMTVRIEGIGDRFGGNYYVTRVAHRMQGNGYRATFDVKELPE